MHIVTANQFDKNVWHFAQVYFIFEDACMSAILYFDTLFLWLFEMNDAVCSNLAYATKM